VAGAVLQEVMGTAEGEMNIAVGGESNRDRTGSVRNVGRSIPNLCG